ncbi:MAG: hypothetical protein JF619_10700 [Massilia sp.]|nr:hypothetical protein [Massilia sp.]
MVKGRERELLKAMFDAAIAAAQPDKCIPPHLSAPPRGRLGDSVVTGPTLTNVNDFRAILVAAPLEGFEQESS